MLKITLNIFFSLVSKSFTLSLTPFPPPPPSSSIANCFSAYCCNLRSTHEIQYHWEAVSHYCEHTNIWLTAVEIDESGSLLVLSRRLFDDILFIFQNVRMSVKKTLLFNPLAHRVTDFWIKCKGHERRGTDHYFKERLIIDMEAPLTGEWITNIGNTFCGFIFREMVLSSFELRVFF